MQVHKLICEFIDNILPECTTVIIEAHYPKRQQKVNLWEQIIKKHPTLIEFKLIKVKSCKVSEGVNISDNLEVNIQSVFCHDVSFKKLIKGSFPTNRTDIFNYPHTCYH